MNMYMLIFVLVINICNAIQCNSVIKNDTIELKCYKTLQYSTLYIEWKSLNETIFIYNTDNVLSSNTKYTNTIKYIPKGLNISTIFTYKNISQCYDCIFYLIDNVTDSVSICIDDNIEYNACILNNNGYRKGFNDLLFILLPLILIKIKN
ncbi:hypothetical protein BTW14_gp167 [BeAn 58058 virus]|uniref:hypothetical protein n=1 Tax=BeAn 58058 virus TaxID=67082 RepID=UPI00090C351D|nr:hypothetical protein BTW14_gp167 [BeAn 58058 virus]APG58358.1 hypothetical protein BAV00181 [BeAn 58058 virus]